MKYSKPVNFLFLLIFSFNLFSCKGNENIIDSDINKTVVEKFGMISAKGNKIVDEHDSTIALHGMSLFWSQWGGQFYNEQCVKWLRDDWHCTIIRASCGIEPDGYLLNPESEFNKITAVIDAAIKYGIYVIVDWHDHKAEEHVDQAKIFFEQIAERYGDHPNIIYELYNEPLQVSWQNVVKPYLEEVIDVIRRHDPDNLIIAGSPNWSQDVDAAASSPITDNNIAYTFHFYTSTHDQSLRNKALLALNKNVPLFISEYGISEASGDGIINYNETLKWFAFVNQNNLSSCNWSVMDKEETSAALVPGASPYGGWKEQDLTESGKYIRNYIRSLNEAIFNELEN